MINIPSILAQLQQHYDDAVHTLRDDVIAFGRAGTIPPQRKREDGSYSYPQVTLRYAGIGAPIDRSRAFGRLEMPGTYTTTITRPDLFATYLTEQLQLIASEYEIEVTVGRSRQEIPFPYVLDGEAGAAMVGISAQDIAAHFPSTDLALIGDELADGIELDEARDMPLSLFDGLRTDYSLARLKHYTGSEVSDFQDFILFTNYHRYVDEFVNWGAQQIGTDGYVALTGAAGLDIREPAANAQDQLNDTAWRR
ncbi:MAG: AMP nucleosidase, partial [Alphaproteobacteria bacterium HGW-Alphaproteobacteria-14]